MFILISLTTVLSFKGGGDTPLYSNLKVIAVPVLASILHTAPLIFKQVVGKKVDKITLL